MAQDNPLRLAGATGSLAILLLMAPALQAAPVLYQYFAPGPAIETRGTLTATPEQRLFDPFSPIAGGFTYDAANATLIGPGPLGGLVYGGALTNFSGYIAGSEFFDPAGRVVVNNDGLPLPQDPATLVDGLVLLAEQLNLTDDLQGFEITDGLGTLFTLVNVRLFWLEGDFLDEDNLPPGALPPEGAAFTRIALDFRAVGDPGTAHTVFFINDVNVAVVPLPAAGWLMLGALGTLAGWGRLRPAAATL